MSSFRLALVGLAPHSLDRSMWVDGLVYFVGMTAVNALNMLILLNTTQPIIQGL